jgi:hypothetical protein
MCSSQVFGQNRFAKPKLPRLPQFVAIALLSITVLYFLPKSFDRQSNCDET